MGAVGWYRRTGRIATLAIALCTHNPRREFLDRTLESLRGQTCPPSQWELLLVDNASTNSVLSTVDLTWHPRARVVREERVGLTMARLRGIAETLTDLLLFVDDDNELAPDYVENLLRLASQHGRLGCFGAGRLEPEFEEEPLDELRPYTHMLALRSVDRTQWSNSPSDGAIPWGAGLAVRREVANAFATMTTSDAQRRQLGRKGEVLHSGEDDEFSWIACGMGHGKGVFPELKITHLISATRVQLKYLLAIAEGHYYSEAILNQLHGISVTEPDSPTFRAAFENLIRLRPRTALLTASRAWHRSRRPLLEREFESAANRGRRSGLEFVQSKLSGEDSHRRGHEAEGLGR